MKEYNDYELVYMISEDFDNIEEILFNKYKPIINKIAYNLYKMNKYLGINMEDLIEEGNVGLLISIKTFNTNNNVLFYTYALHNIKGRMLNLIKKCTTKKNNAFNNSISLDSYYKDTNLSLIDLIEDNNANIPDKECEYIDIIKIIKDILYKKDIISSSILELRLNGFNNDEISKLLYIPKKTITTKLSILKKELRLILNKVY